MEKKKICIIVDVDGTIVNEKDNSQIVLPIEDNREIWDLFHKNKKYYTISQFKQNKNVVEIIKSLVKNIPDLFIIFLTAREDVKDKPISHID